MEESYSSEAIRVGNVIADFKQSDAWKILEGYIVSAIMSNTDSLVKGDDVTQDERRRGTIGAYKDILIQLETWIATRDRELEDRKKEELIEE